MNRDTKGMLLVFFSALVWSTNSVLIKSISLPPLLIAGMRAAFAGVFYAAFIRPGKIKWNLKFLLLLVVYAIQGACIVVAVKLTSAAIAVGMQFTAPVWIYLYQRIFKKYPFYMRRAVPLVVLSAGVVISMFSRADNVTMAGNLLALSTGVLFAVSTMINKDVSAENPIGVVSVQNLFLAAVILPVFCTDSIPQLFTMDATSWILLAVLGIGQYGFGYVLYTLGLRYTTPAKAAMISPMEMVLSPIWVALVIGELPDVTGLIGFLVIIAGIALEIVFTVQYNKAAQLSAAGKAKDQDPVSF